MRKWLVTFVLGCFAAVVFVLAALWAFSGFAGLGIGLWGALALAGGIIFTVGLGVGLMALIFASDRSNKDEEVGHLDVGHLDTGLR